METSIEWSHYQRFDNANVIDFISSTASGLTEAEILSSSDSEDLRAFFINFNKKESQTSQSVLSQLAEENHEFLSLIISRWGEVGLFLNILRRTLAPSITHTNKILLQFGESIVKKTDLIFNRPFYFFKGDKCERRVLISGILLELANAINECAETTNGICNKLSRMLPCDMAYPTEDDQALDDKLKKYLGFNDIKNDAIPFRTENLIRAQYVGMITELVDLFDDFIKQYQLNCNKNLSAEISIIFEWLKSACYRLSNIRFATEGNFEIWELQRRNFNSTIYSINNNLKNLSERFLSFLTPSNLTTEVKNIIPKSIERHISFDLIRKGIPASTATDAANRLISYCKEQNVSPNEIIPSEISRIHSHLTINSLRILQEIDTDKSLSAKATKEKEIIMIQNKKLLRQFKEKLLALTPSLIALLSVMLFAGCGIKTPPKSGVPDFRPEIPFKKESQNRPASIDKDVKKETSFKVDEKIFPYA